MDFQYELVDDGAGGQKAVVVTGDYNKQVMNANSFYRVLGIKKIEDGSPSIKYVMELIDEESGRILAFTRESQEAIYELANVLHDNTVDANSIDEKLQRKIKQQNKIDRARRYYENMFSMDTAQSKGYRAAKRMYENARFLKQRLEGKYTEIQKRAEEIVNKVVREREAAGYSMSADEIDSLRYETQGNLMKHRITHDEMMKRMNFTSLYDDATKSFVHNQQEQKNFFMLAARLMSEEKSYNEAIDLIEKRFGGESMEQIDKKARALMEFHQQFRSAVGGDETTRKAKGYEKNAIRVYDMKAEKNYILSLHDDDGEKSIRRKVYQGLSEMEPEDRERIAKNRLKMIIADMSHSGHIAKKQEDALFDMFSEHRQNMQTSDMVSEVVNQARKSKHRHKY
jgi:nanoRNase/pAp phosphatase (c-di-AMP/oligoRNAs hydrolase)